MAAMEPLSDEEERFWRSMMQFLIVAPRVMDDDFGRDSHLATSEYGVLMNLSEAPDRELRMSELASRTALSASRITRVVDDLSRAGLVTKTRCPSDRRGNVAALTVGGLERLQAAYRPHLHRVRTRFLDGLPAEEIAVAGTVIERMLETVEQSLNDSDQLPPSSPVQGSDGSTR